MCDISVEDHACAARHAFVGEVFSLMGIWVFRDFDVVDEGVPFLPLADVQDRVVDDLRRRVNCCTRVSREESAAWDVMAAARASEVWVVKVFARKRRHSSRQSTF